MKVLVTGGCGFIGSAVVQYLLKNSNYDIAIVDKLSYASKGLMRVRDFDPKRVSVFTWDLTLPFTEGLVQELGDVNIILHLCAESHVDDSIANPVPFIQNNINSTCQILEYARTLKNLDKFFYFSTDEVYGNAPGDKLYTEEDRHDPRNPYSASKSASEMICLSYANTYNIPLISLNSMNVFGIKQHVQKFIPKVIKSILDEETVYIHSYADCKQSGSRFYIHTDNIAAAVFFLMNHGKIGQCYNVTGEEEVSNLDLALMISKIMNKPLNYEMVDFHSSRPGHDLRYGLDGTKMKKMGWVLPFTFKEHLEKTVLWTVEHPEWLEE